MITIAITGGIGCGKSTVCRIIESMGFPVYYADNRAKLLMSSSFSIREALIKLYGNDIYIGNNINKSLLSSIIFNSKKDLELVNNIVHPVVKEDFIMWSLEQKSSLVFQESAIVFESNHQDSFNYIIVVKSDLKTRINRVILRENCNIVSVIERINNQLPQEHLVSLADFTIENSESHALLPQINYILNNIK